MSHSFIISAYNTTSYIHLYFCASSYSLFFFTHTVTTDIYTLSLHDALPIFFFISTVIIRCICFSYSCRCIYFFKNRNRSEEHTSELQSRGHLVCRLLLEKKKITKNIWQILTTKIIKHQT